MDEKDLINGDDMESLLDMEQPQQDIRMEIHAREKKLKPLVEEPRELELKLMDHFEYAFLAEGSKLPVIISTRL